MKLPPSAPILSCAETRIFERRFFGGDEAREWEAMERAGAAVAAAVLRDFREIGGFPAAGALLVLAGKGNNGGDALIAARRILELFPSAHAEVVLAFGPRGLRPLAQRAWQQLAQFGRIRVSSSDSPRRRGRYDVCLDGVFGFQFRPPLPARAAALLHRVNALPIRLRAAVDLPSGLGEGGLPDPAAFRADFTYATGGVKRPVVGAAAAACVGRLRYLDLGFFDLENPPTRERMLTSRVLDPLRDLRRPDSDKRTYGHLVLLGGSHGYPGAILMSVLAALRSGVGLLTACVPESLAPAFAARAPEAMWVGLPESPQGGLALEGRRRLQELLKRATALALGPGLGREPETLALVREVVGHATVPLLIDADALQPDIVRTGTAPRILTPHAGEWERIKSAGGSRRPSGFDQAVIVHKGRLTAVTQRGKKPFLSPFGGPVLARGGSGDILTGLTGGLLAQTPEDPLLAACRGVVWHGQAADALARSQGQTAVQVTQLLEYLHAVLHGE
jgi:hydroxyethylthiazole kinase-like uncharacterized protein yjeF